MTGPEGERCATCVYWQRQGHEVAAQTIDHGSPPEVGTCHYSPPRVADIAPFAAGLWPRTNEGRWCGGWEGPEPDGGGSDVEVGNVVPFREAA